MRGVWGHGGPGPSRWRLLVALVTFLVGVVAGGSADAATADSPRSSLPGAFATLRNLAADLNEQVLALALAAFRQARERGEITRDILTVIDYSLPSSRRRLWVLDVAKARLLFHDLVAHGEASGAALAESFSNEPRSRKSSLGLFVTGETYRGRHGVSLRLRGLAPGLNDHAESRAIVVHGAKYVSFAQAVQRGAIGRSWGCPAVRPEIAAALIDTIKDGSAVFSYYPDDRLASSGS